MTFKGTYIGPIESLKGETALLQWGAFGEVEAQFDDPIAIHPHMSEDRAWACDTNHGKRLLGFGWTSFDVADFDIYEIGEI